MRNLVQDIIYFYYFQISWVLFFGDNSVVSDFTFSTGIVAGFDEKLPINKETKLIGKTSIIHAAEYKVVGNVINA